MMDDGSTDGLQTEGPRTHRFQHQGDGLVATTVALAVAEVDDVDPTAMEPLYGAVDPGLLERLTDGGRQLTGDVMFTYRGYRVTVDSDGGVLLAPAADH